MLIDLQASGEQRNDSHNRPIDQREKYDSNENLRSTHCKWQQEASVKAEGANDVVENNADALGHLLNGKNSVCEGNQKRKNKIIEQIIGRDQDQLIFCSVDKPHDQGIAQCNKGEKDTGVF